MRFLAKFVQIYEILHTYFLQNYWIYTNLFQFQQKKGQNIFIFIYLYLFAVLLSAKIVKFYAILVCKNFGPKIRLCKFFDKHVCPGKIRYASYSSMNMPLKLENQKPYTVISFCALGIIL